MAPDIVAAGRKRKREESSSITPTSSAINYQVFLNFRGEDIRQGFLNHLYGKLENAGIEVFKDDEKLHGGEEIGPTLKDAIKRSRISIAIFSKKYASSRYCLMELEQMWECRQADGHTLIPIFYDVSPSALKSRNEGFAESLKKHEDDGKVDANIIKNWRKVLRHVGGLSGYELAKINGGDEATLLRKVLERVREVLDEDDQDVPDKLVGIGPRFHEMMTKLGVVYGQGEATKVCGQDRRVVGICGMPGVGKTTLAKVIFNKIRKSFHRCSFLEGINSERLKVSPDRLIAELKNEKHDPQRPIRGSTTKLRSLFTNMKVLIVLDDVHERKQIEVLAGNLSWLGHGSRIIVTTDNRDVLNVFDKVPVEECKVEPMGMYHALKLFREHAFPEDARQDVTKFESLSRDIVEALEGLPMAIVLRATRLKRQNIEIWRSTRDLLKRYPCEGEVEAALKASYDSLNDRAKEVFLDIACFFIGKDERVPTYMWKAGDCFPPLETKELRDMHFLEDGENNELRMHRVLRDFGRKIVEEKKVLQKRCRIWKFSDASFILADTQPNGSVRGISLTVEEGGTVRFTCGALAKKLNLRYLRLDEANGEGTSDKLLPNFSELPLEEGNIEGKSENLLPNLMWLDWHTYRFIPELCHVDLKKLLILDLSWSPVTRYSQVWSQIMKKVEELKVLNLQGCNLFKASLLSSASTGLEILIMEGCTRSPDVGAFISKLKLLKSLNLRKCEGVQQLVQQLYGKEFLTELLIDETDIEEIHIKNDSLNDLEILSARDCEKLKDISSIGHLTKLRSLALDGAIIDWVPETFEFPPNLERLSLRKCEKLFELPPSIGKLKQLKEMDLSDTGITKLPESVKDLSNLKTLKMERAPLQKFPEDIVNLKKLEEIDFSGCTNLEAQDSCDISGLFSLRILSLSSSDVAGLPQGICRLSCLQTLDVCRCERLQALPELPSSLVTLRWGSKIMEAPELTNLTNLKELCLNADTDTDEQPEAESLDQTPDMGWIIGLTSLKTLELSLPNVTNLPGDFRALTHLWELTLSYMKELDLTQLPSSSSLWTLRLKHCKIREPKFSGLTYLSELELEDCDLEKIDGLKDLQNLEVLKIFRCCRMTDFDGLINLPRLRKVQGFSSALASLPKLSKRVELDICDLPSSWSVV